MKQSHKFQHTDVSRSDTIGTLLTIAWHVSVLLPDKSRNIVRIGIDAARVARKMRQGNDTSDPKQAV
ncbi:MAG: hypothetical protein AAF702_11830 [Chloroflexota bacterium]